MANTNMSFSSFSLYLVLLFTISLNLVLSSTTTSVRSTSEIASSSSSSLHIIYTSERPSNETPEAFNLRILTSVLGSNEAAKKALVYSFKNSMSGFAANLTPDQVKKISEQPGVVHAVRSVSYNLTEGINNKNV